VRAACVRCGRTTEARDAVCDDCKSRVNPQASPYWETKWRQRSAEFLSKNPWCVLCEAEGKRAGVPLQAKATVADHYPHTRKELLARAISDPDEERYLRPLCAPHHASHGRRSNMRFTNDSA